MAWTILRESGRYQGCYRNAAGDQCYAGTFDKEKDALLAATVAEHEQRQPHALDPRDGRITWGDWFDTWHDSRALAYSTDMTYRSTADTHIRPKWGAVSLEDITELELSRWVARMLKPRGRNEAPVSVWSVRNALMLMKTSLNAAVRAKRLPLSPAKEVAYPDLPQGQERYLTPDEVEAIAFHMDGLNALIVWMSVQTGLRFGELAGLHWNRVDLDRGVIRVVEKFDQKSGHMDPLPKDNEQRTVPLTDDLVERLDHLRQYGRHDLARTCGVPHVAGRCHSDLVFRGPRGAVIKSSDWGRGPWAAALRLAGIEGRVRPHDMRHTYASWLLQMGVHLAELARMMGHTDLEVTMRYAHLSELGFDTVREALARRRREAARKADYRLRRSHEGGRGVEEDAG